MVTILYVNMLPFLFYIKRLYTGEVILSKVYMDWTHDLPHTGRMLNHYTTEACPPRPYYVFKIWIACFFEINIFDLFERSLN